MSDTDTSLHAAVLYFSKSGNTAKMADVIAEGMGRVPGLTAKAFSLENADEDWIRNSRCLVLGSPIYVSSVAAPVKSWLDGPARGLGLPGKLGGAFATCDYVHGGGDLGIRLILDHMLVYGMLAYSGGGACGKPVIHLGPVAIAGRLAEYRETFLAFGERMAKKTVELFG
ncbi:MAG: flavodoxin [Desulfovibrionaceae bacterium]|nr:flavodoxin [Desulfovibrionaceae bacterium]